MPDRGGRPFTAGVDDVHNCGSALIATKANGMGTLIVTELVTLDGVALAPPSVDPR